MIEWANNLPWLEMLVASTLLLAVVLVFLLSVNKYPNSKALGFHQVAMLCLPLSFAFPSNQLAGWIVLLLVSCSLYYYVRSFFIQSIRSSFKYLIPFLLGLFVFCGNALLNNNQFIAILLRFFIITMSLVYFYWMLKRIKMEGKQRGINWSLNPGGRLNWFRSYVSLNLIFIVIWGFHEILPHELILLTILINIGFIYYQVFKESAFLSPIPVHNKYQKSTLTPEQKFAISNKLNELLNEQKFYLNNEISLSKLAKDLHTTTHHLSQVINETKGITFQELIGQYRIKEAKLLLRDASNSHLKIENIATEVGYNSKSAFNTAFKRFTGMTPTEFKATKDVQTYREERRPERKRPSSKWFPLSLDHVSTIKIESYMITNFFKIFIRTLIRNKAFTAINIVGLVVGFTCSILIYVFMSDELSYDTEITDYNQLYRISWYTDNPQTRTPHPMAQAMVKDMPEVEQATSISPWYGAGLSKQTIRVKNIKEQVFFDEPDFFFVDSTFLDVFQLELIAGDPRALSKPWNIVISNEMAKKYFGEQDPIGKLLHVNDMPVEVAAVIKEMPKNSHFHFKGLISYVTTKAINPDDNWYTWDDFGHFNYIKLKKGVDPAIIQAKIPQWVSPYLDWAQADLDRLNDGDYHFELQPIKDIHLTSHLKWELENNGNILYIYILTGTLIFILIIIIVNYVNLTNAKSLERAREVGIRKTLGAFSGNLRLQFYLESFLFCFIALVIALVMSVMLLEPFNQLSGKLFESSDIFNLEFISKIILANIAIALIAGIYPALTLSSFVPSEVLKTKIPIAFQSTNIRGTLVVIQFFVSAILIIASLIVLKQVDFMRSKELGFDQEAIISTKIHSSAKLGGIDIAAIKVAQEKIGQIPGVKSSSLISNLPGKQFNQHRIYAANDLGNTVDASEIFVDYNLLDLLNIEIINGRDFSRTYTSDSSGHNVVLNESAVKQLNLKDPIGQKIVWLNNDRKEELTVIGVAKDFHYKSLHESIKPLLILVNPNRINHLVIKLDGNNFQQSISAIEKVYDSFNQDVSFEYHFLDQQLAKLYDQEINTLNIFSIFAGIALFLACLGLIGMALAILHQKVKEIGIRKILGATAPQLMAMILKQFARLIVIALLLGLPVGYLILQNWLTEFSYQVNLGIIPFILSAAILLVVALLSVSLVVIKIAFSNPIDSIRYE